MSDKSNETNEIAAVAEVGGKGVIQPRDPLVQILATALATPFEVSVLKFKPQIVKNNRALAMAYIDARVIQDRLDDVLGVENWQDKYDFLPDGGVVCHLRLNLGGKWITKTDVGSPSEQPDAGDRVKAAVSDALKRAAVKFGIARYLHKLTATWVDYDPVKKQITQLPQLPSWALPPKSAKVAALPAQKVQSPAVKPPAALPEAKPPVKPPVKPPIVCGTMPANGAELYERLYAYDRKLAGEKKCVAGALLHYVTNAGVEANRGNNIKAWDSKEAIEFAYSTVRKFENAMAPKPVATPA